MLFTEKTFVTFRLLNLSCLRSPNNIFFLVIRSQFGFCTSEPEHVIICCDNIQSEKSQLLSLKRTPKFHLIQRKRTISRAPRNVIYGLTSVPTWHRRDSITATISPAAHTDSNENVPVQTITCRFLWMKPIYSKGGVGVFVLPLYTYSQPHRNKPTQSDLIASRL